MRTSRKDCVVYVGELPDDVREREVEDLFWDASSVANVEGAKTNNEAEMKQKRSIWTDLEEHISFGRIVNIDLKTSGRPPAYAFIEFDHPRDAQDAVRARNDFRFGRSRLRVEIARGASGPPQAPPNWRKKGTGFRIIVEGLPRHASWQDLKDMFRKVDPPVYTNVYSDTKGVFGVVEYNSHRELRQVIADMRGAEFKNPFCDPTPVYLLDDTDKEDQDPAGSLSPRSDRRQRSTSRTRDRRSRSR